MKILYIAGYGRSGTTILDNTLAQVDGFVTVGEMRYIWDRGIQKDWTCGCGESFSNCKFWTRILESEPWMCQQSERMLDHLDPIRRGGKLIRRLRTLGHKHNVSFDRPEFVDGLRQVYSAVAQLSEADLVIDSSKWPFYGRYLSEIQGVELYVIHITRDPRAVAYSWMRRKAYDPFLAEPFFIRRLPTIRVAIEWTLWNMSADRLQDLNPDRYLNLRYEDFVHEPRMAVGAILDFVGESDRPNPVDFNNTVQLDKNHCVAGNPVRFIRGPVRIEPDSEWKSKLSALNAQIVRAISSVQMRKYGYMDLSTESAMALSRISK